MSRAFDLAIAFVLNVNVEGEYSDDPQDPGGETRFGISQQAHPAVDIANLTREEAVEIYRRSYWDACRCDEFPPALALALFDAAVNQGPAKAVKLLQRALGEEVDGVVGPDTLSAAARALPDEALIQFLSRRAYEYARGNPRFMRGWFVRLFRLQRAILGLA